MKAVDIILLIGVVAGAGLVTMYFAEGRISIPNIGNIFGSGGGGGGKKDDNEEDSIVQNLTKEKGGVLSEEGFGIVRDWIKEGFKLGEKEIKELADRLAIKKPMAPTKQLGITSTDTTRPYKKVNRDAPESILDMIWPTIDRILPDLTIFAADKAKKKKRAVVNRDAPESELIWGPQFGPELPDFSGFDLGDIKKPDFSRLTSGTRTD